MWTRLALLVLLVAGAAPAGAAVYRCVGAGGVPVYADKPCEQVDAVPRRPRPDAFAEPGPAPLQAGCPAPTTPELIAAIRAANRSADINRLAALYHWPGQSPASARWLLERMEPVVEQPLRAISLATPELGRATAADGVLPDVRIELGATDRRPALAMRFSLVRHAGCLWLGSLR